jgi:hypothetical protein
MPTFLARAFGLFLLTLAITVSSCQAVFQRGSSRDAPQQLSPGSFEQ